MKTRKFVSLFLLYCLVVMIVSGIVLYIMPHGRVAYWTGWRFLGLDKDQWDAVHTIFGFLMVIFGIWHVILNWKNIVKYIEKSGGIFLSATILTLVCLIGTILNVPPFSSFMSLGEKIKNSWKKPAVMPPAPHAELFTLERVSSTLGISPSKAVAILQSKGLKVESPKETLKQIAVENGVTPAYVYSILKRAVSFNVNRRSAIFVPGSGMGRKTLREICREMGIPVNRCVIVLKQNGLKNVSPDTTLRDIAFGNGMYPYQVFQILQEVKR